MAAFSRYRLIFVLAALPLMQASRIQDIQVQNVNRKFDLIEHDRVTPGGRVFLSANELAAYAQEQAEVIAPRAISGAALTIGQGTAVAKATINFLELRKAAGDNPNWVMRQILEGQRPLKVTGRIQSWGGRARVDVDRVELSGIAVDGKTLDFLLKEFVIPSFPEATVGSWFQMEHNIEKLELKPGAVNVWIKSRH